MKFTVSTKPLKDALDLGVIKSNVSKFYQKSCLAQITASGNVLKINLEAAAVTSEITLKGQSDEEGSRTTFVDCLVLKDLVHTLDASTTTIEYTSGGIIIHSGKSKFTVPQMVEESDLELNKPSIIPANAEAIDLTKADWKFIDDHQMYAIAMSFIHPVYTNVWVGESGDVLVGDFDNSIFTLSKKSKLGDTCLLPDTIINLFNSLPEGSKIIKLDNSYVVNVTTDSFEYSAEFTPKREDDEGVGSYNSQIILQMLNTSDDAAISLNVEKINKALSQATLLSNDSENTILFKVDGKDVTLKDDNIDCKIELENDAPENYEITFKTVLLKSMLANMDEETIKVMPMKQDDGEGGSIYSGIVSWTKNMSVVLAGQEDE